MLRTRMVPVWGCGTAKRVKHIVSGAVRWTACMVAAIGSGPCGRAYCCNLPGDTLSLFALSS